MTRTFGLVTAVLAGFAAIAAGQTINDLTFTPPNPQVGEEVTFTITGAPGNSPSCDQINLVFGDAGAGGAGGSQIIKNKTFPITGVFTKHTYMVEGSFTAKATGVGNCVGQAKTAQVTVVKKGMGMVKGLAFTPQQAFALEKQFTIQADKSCSAFKLDFGDSTPPQPLGASLTATHGYEIPAGLKEKTFKATATSGNCTGSATVLVKVVRLKLKFSPKITGVLPFSNFTPGGTVVLLGSVFGDEPGKMLVHLKTFSGQPLPDVVVPVLQWHSDFVGGTLPKDICGVLDQDATFEIQTKSGSSSNKFTGKFRAKRVVDLLPRKDPAVTVVSCGLDANIDGCNEVGEDDDLFQLFNGAPFTTCCEGTFAGNHWNCWGCIGDDKGTDVYKATLGNGWVLDHMDFSKEVEEGQGFVIPPAGFSEGSTQWTANIQWLVTPNDQVTYAVSVFVKGPCGVPHLGK